MSLESESRRPRNLGVSLVSKNILEGKGKLKWCIKTETSNPDDNGWMFFSDIDNDDFLKVPKNMVLVQWDEVVEIEPTIEIIYSCPIGTDLMLIEEKGEKHFFDRETGCRVL